MLSEKAVAGSAVESGLISVVIPTYRRVSMLREAVLSAARQSYPQVEVVVVSDGPDPEARAAVGDLHPRVRYFELEKNAGPAAARNHGILHSRGEWIAFLDDDDLMLPDRLLRHAVDVDPAHPEIMSACRLLYRRASGGTERDDVWPARPIAPSEDLGDYLLVRPSLLGRPGVVSLQALLVHHTLARQVPMPSLPEHEDWAWLLEVWHRAGGRIRFFWEPLVVYRIDIATNSRSRRPNWYDSLKFALTYRHWLSSRAFCSFLSSKVAIKARQAGDWTGLRAVYRLLRGNGGSLRDYVFFVAIALLPLEAVRQVWLRSLRRDRPASSAKDSESTTSSRTRR